VIFVKINSGGYSTYAIDRSGQWAWGGNQNGQLGMGTGAPIEAQPVDVSIRLSQVSSTASNVAGLERR
jgi:alpha-tubulin suppressor-like RCC1 family protein